MTIIFVTYDGVSVVFIQSNYPIATWKACSRKIYLEFSICLLLVFWIQLCDSDWFMLNTISIASIIDSECFTLDITRVSSSRSLAMSFVVEGNYCDFIPCAKISINVNVRNRGRLFLGKIRILLSIGRSYGYKSQEDVRGKKDSC